MKNLALRVVLLGCVMQAGTAAHAAVSLDRTRAVYDGDNKSITLNIQNINKQLPYLAQAWLEDANMKKMNGGALVLTPPVQRLEPGTSGILRIEKTAASNILAQDKESLFYLNLREIPPRSEQANVMQVALQTKIKLFYRPKAIKAPSGAFWFDQIVLNKSGNGYRIENPTPYFVTIIGIGSSEADSVKGAFKPVMVSPKSTLDTAQGTYATPYVTFINDFGGQDVLKFQCAGSVCKTQKTK